MKNNLSKLKRQIEILGICLNNSSKLDTLDLACIFGCDVVTIKRDLQDLRSLGIDIHSQKGRGVVVFNKLESTSLVELIQQYIAICAPEHTIDKATSALVKARKENALSFIVILQRCIESCSIAIIDYELKVSNKLEGIEISPLAIFQSENQWRVLALNDGVVKQYLLPKITRVQQTNRKFKPVSKNIIDELFKYSLGSWVGADKYKVRLHLSKTWANRIKPFQFPECRIISENKDGSLELETMVNSLNEIAGWIVCRGEGIVVLEPDELKEYVISLAKGTLRNYEK